MKTSDPIVVVGWARSGSSAVAEILINLGVSMGRDFASGDDHNPNGYFEDHDFLWVQRCLTAKYQVPKHYPELKNPHDAISYLMRKKRSINAGQPWGFKHPPILDSIDIWLSHLGRNAKFIFCDRPKDEVMESWDKAFNQEGAWPKRRIKQRLRLREKALKRLKDEGWDLLIVDFHELLTSTEDVVDDIIRFTGLETFSKQDAINVVNPEYSKSSNLDN